MSVKISELPVLDSLADNDVLAGVDTSANTTSKVTLGSLKQYIDTNTQYTAGTNIDITNNVVSAPNVYNKTETDNLLNAKENISNKVTTLSSSSTNTQYPSAKIVYDELNDLETDLTNNINDLNDEINNQINNKIQELEEELESVSTIFNAFPTESEEGESLTLDDTAEVKFKKLDLKGNTYQTQYSGKNLLPPTIATETKNGITLTNNGDGSYTLTGTYSSSTEFSIDLPTTLNGTYSFSGNNPASSNNIQFRILTSSGSPWSTYLNNVNKTSEDQTIENGTKQGIRIVGSFTSGFTLKPQLESGSTATSYEPYVGGSASPNPEFPQPVNVVSGDNEINVVGKNLFGNYDEINITRLGINANANKDKITTSGTTTSEGFLFNTNNRPEIYLEAGTYTFSINNFSGTFPTVMSAVLKGEPGTPNIIDVRFTTTLTKTFTITTSATYYFDLYISTTNAPFNSSFNIQIEKGSQSTTYEPYQGNTYNIDLPVENLAQNNLVNETYNSLQITKNSDGSFTLNGNPTSSFGRDIDTNITLKKGTYTISANSMPSGLYIALDNTSETQLSSGTLSKTFTLASDTTYTSLGIWFTKEKNYNVTIKLQLEKGSKANSYTPYGTTPIELCKIGDYTDYFYKSNGIWYKYGAIGKFIFDGTIEFSRSNTRDTFTSFFYLNNTIKMGGECVSNRLVYVSQYGNVTGALTEGIAIHGAVQRIYLSVPTSLASTWEELRTWLATNNIIVYYVLATPTNTEITYQPLIDQLNELEKAISYEGQTNISQVNNDLPFIIDAEAILSLKNVLDRVTLLES